MIFELETHLFNNCSSLDHEFLYDMDNDIAYLSFCSQRPWTLQSISGQLMSLRQLDPIAVIVQEKFEKLEKSDKNWPFCDGVTQSEYCEAFLLDLWGLVDSSESRQVLKLTIVYEDETKDEILTTYRFDVSTI